MRLLLVVSTLLFLAALAGAEDSLRFGHFAESGLEGWQHKRFQGETEYRIVDDGGQKVLQATSRAAASGLVYETTYQPATYPVLTWRWKVDRVIAKGDSRTKAGDDYAARVYVVFPHWFFPKTRTLNYLWANRLPVGAVQPNAFTGNAMMIAVESGPGRVGQWVTERRNIVDDYRRAFGEDPPAVGAIAIMTDTDNTAESATAWYAEIKALRR
jgi:hypothetical protein